LRERERESKQLEVGHKLDTREKHVSIKKEKTPHAFHLVISYKQNKVMFIHI
jgi:hypothetical protein